MYSSLTGGNEIYMYGLGIVMGNEDYHMWKLFNKLFKRACTMVSELKVRQKYSKFVFVNRILSKVQKSFWSCTHVNSCTKITLHINLHILLMFYSRRD